MFLMVWMASSLQPPKDSTTRGMKVTPAARQAPGSQLMGWATQRGLRPRLVATSHRLAMCVIVRGFRAALDLDTYPLSNLIRPRCAERATPGRGKCHHSPAPCYSHKGIGSMAEWTSSATLGNEVRQQHTTHCDAVGLRLGSDLVEEHKCACGSQVSRKGTHGLSCRRSGGRFARHHAAQHSCVIT